MAHPVVTKAFLLLSRHIAMLFLLIAEPTHFSITLFLLMKN